MKYPKRAMFTPSFPSSALTAKLFNLITKRRARNSRIIIDCTDVSVDLNWFRKRKQANLLKKDYKWGYSAKR